MSFLKRQENERNDSKSCNFQETYTPDTRRTLISRLRRGQRVWAGTFLNKKLRWLWSTKDARHHQSCKACCHRTMRQHSMGMRLATMQMADSHEWINKVCHSHKIKRCLVIKRKCGYTPQSGWTSEHDAEQQKWVTEDYTRRIYSHKIHHQSIHKESRSVGAWGGGRRQWGWGTGFLLGAGYTIFWLTQFKWMN